MLNELLTFLKSEYTNADCQPVYIRLFGRNYLIPYVYFRGYQDYRKAFLNDFFDAQNKDCTLYKRYQLLPQYISFKNEQYTHRFVVPFDIRQQNLTPQQIALRIFKRAEKTYFKAVRLCMKLAQACPELEFECYINLEQIKKMQKAYYEFQLKNARSDLAYLTKKIGLFFSRNAQKVTNRFEALQISDLRLMVRRWSVKSMLAATVSAVVYSTCVNSEEDDIKK